eukprot:CAMPEP_0181514132 /NCGR_PEP_ID=MMETSP1110-20121109/62868_1 /TAXON_ID=174948 /ORGANISM="Symbiodinium sp., Strain CCMP421" /LENGTH=33 /DNA_ID= /DNA_START= /DNA_END= /DNA_ORIENTATION=
MQFAATPNPATTTTPPNASNAESLQGDFCASSR